MTAPKLDDATPFPWSHVRRPARNIKFGDAARKGRGTRSAVYSEPERGRVQVPQSPPFLPEEMQAVAVALFGECTTCRALLDIDGTCPAKSEHPKHECRGCGAMHDTPVTVAHSCLFCSNTEAAQ